MMSRKSQLTTVKYICLFLLVIALIFIGRQINFSEILQSSAMWVKSLGIWGAIAYIILYNLATLLFVPGSILTIKGGCLFGLFWGSVYVIIAAIIGAVITFCLGRYVSRNWVCQQLEKYPKFQAIDRAVATAGLKIVLLTRLSPIFPFNLLNYAFGITQVSLKDYILGSLGIIPGTLMYVYIGSLASDVVMANMSATPMDRTAQTWQIIMQVIGLVATIAVTIYISRIAQKALQENMD
ncbi:SNARE associated Golgi family protein [Calothrix sp. 336/3]|nr:SNARE associated Golgi family protein [Calothrix sp. 336/3]